MERLRIRFPIKLHIRKPQFCLNIVGCDGQSAIAGQPCFGIAPKKCVTASKLLQRMNVTRIEVDCALKATYGVFPSSPTALDGTRQLEYVCIIGQTLTGNFQLGQGSVIVEVSSIEVLRARKVCFARVGTKAKSRLNRCLC